MLRHCHYITTVFLLLALAACSIPLVQKDGSEALLAAQQQQDLKNYTFAKDAYMIALDSGRRDIRAQAYYGLSKIDRQNKDFQSSIDNLEMAAALIPEKYELKLAQAYYKYGDENNKNNAKELFLNYQDMNVNANLVLAEMSKDKTPYLKKARELLMARGVYDFDGENSLKLAQTYVVYDMTPDFKKAEYYYRQSIAKGNATAAYELAKMWQDNNLRDNTHMDALTLIKKAAGRNHQKSIKHIAQSYAEDHDIVNATFWYGVLADDYDERTAHDYLAQIYLKNAKPNATKFPSLPLNHYREANRQGSKKSNLVLAIWDNQKKLIKGMSDKDVLKQADILEDSFGQRQPHLKRDLNNFLARNNIVRPKNITTASIKREDKFSKTLAKARGLMTQPDNKDNLLNAFNLYKTAAEDGSAEAQYQLGLMYARGFGIEKNMEQAREWLEKAGNNGYPLALETLESLSQNEE